MNNEELVRILDQITIASEFAPFIPVLVALLRWKHLSPAQRAFGLVVMLIFVNQMAAKAWYEWFELSNIPFYYSYFFIEMPGILLLYRWRFRTHTIARIIPWVVVVLLLFTILNGLFLQGWYRFPTYSRSAQAVVMVLTALFYFRLVFKERKVRHLDRSFWFWISAGLLLYFTCNLLMFMFTNWLMEKEDELFVAVWAIHAVLNFVLYGRYALGLLCKDQESS